MSETIIDSLVIEVEAKSKGASKEIDALASSLGRLRQAASLTKVTNNLRKLSEGLKGISANSSGLEKIDSLAKNLNKLKSVDDLKNFKAAINSLKNIPKITESLKPQMINEFAVKMNMLSNALKPLSTQISAISAGFNRLPNRISSCVTATNRMTHGVGKMKKGFKGIMSLNIAGLFRHLSAMFLGDIFSSATTEINDYIEKMNYASQVMGDFFPRAKEYASLIEEKMGINSKDFLTAQTSFMTMAQGFGLAGEKAYELSKGMTELGYDMVSLVNMNPEQVFQKLQSAIAGEIEPVRRWGIALDQATMQEWLAKRGIDAKVGSLNQASKALIRYNMAVETIAKNGAIYDMSRTLSSPANALRILQAQFVKLSQVIGSVFIPMLVKVLPVIQVVTSFITNLITKLATLVGFEMPKWDSQSWQGAVGGTSDIKDNLGGAAKAAKKVKDYVMGFDELNIIKPPEPASGGGSASAGAGAGIDLDIPKVWDENVIKAIETRTEKLKGKLNPLLWLITAIGAAFLLWKIAPAIFKGLETLKFLLGVLRGKMMVPATAGQASILGWLSKFGKYILPVTLTVMALTALALIVVDLWKNSEKFRKGWERMCDRIGEAIETAKTKIEESINNMLEALGLPKISLSELYGKYVRPIMEKIGLLFLDVLGNIVTGQIEMFTGVLQTATGIVVGLFKGDWTQAIEGVKTTFLGVFHMLPTPLQEGLKIMYEKTKEGFGKIKQWFDTNVKPKFTKEYWLNIGKGIVDGFRETFRKLKSLAISQVNAIIDKLNAFADFTIPGLEIGGKKIWGSKRITLFTIPHIQGFAKGGFIEDGLFTMNKGEMAGKFKDGKSVVANNQQIVKGITEGVTAGITIAIGASFKEMMPLAIAGITNVKAMIERMSEKIIVAMEREFRDAISALNSSLEDTKSTITSAVGSASSQISSAVGSAASQISGAIGSLSSQMQQTVPQYESSPAPPSKPTKPSKKPTKPSKKPIRRYANGGFLEDGLFTMSNNEIVGKFNNGKSVVANNQQIIEGISQGVYQAMINANGGKTDRPLEVKVYLDGKQITSTVNKHNNERGKSLFGNELGYNY